MRKILFSLLAGFMLFPVAQAQAQYPEKNITMIVPFAAGGSSDIVARALAVPLSKHLGKTIVIKNTTGGSGTIGAAELAKAKPDGYTIGFMPPGPIILQQYQRKLPYDDTSFDYLGKATDYPVVLMSSKKVPWKNFQEMEAELRVHTDQYIYGSSGVGTIPHISAAVLFKKMNINIRHMPSTDAATNMTSLAGGTTHFYSDLIGLAVQHDLLPLAIFTPERDKDFPDLPTVKELGYDIPELRVNQGVLAPKGLPAGIRDILDNAIYLAVQDPVFQEAAIKMSVPPAPMKAEGFLKEYRDVMNSYMTVMEELGFSKY